MISMSRFPAGGFGTMIAESSVVVLGIVLVVPLRSTIRPE